MRKKRRKIKKKFEYKKSHNITVPIVYLNCRNQN